MVNSLGLQNVKEAIEWRHSFEQNRGYAKVRAEMEKCEEAIHVREGNDAECLVSW